MLKSHDKDKNRELDFDEFKNMATHKPERPGGFEEPEKADLWKIPLCYGHIYFLYTNKERISLAIDASAKTTLPRSIVF